MPKNTEKCKHMLQYMFLNLNVVRIKELSFLPAWPVSILAFSLVWNSWNIIAVGYWVYHVYLRKPPLVLFI